MPAKKPLLRFAIAAAFAVQAATVVACPVQLPSLSYAEGVVNGLQPTPRARGIDELASNTRSVQNENEMAPGEMFEHPELKLPKPALHRQAVTFQETAYQPFEVLPAIVPSKLAAQEAAGFDSAIDAQSPNLSPTSVMEVTPTLPLNTFSVSDATGFQKPSQLEPAQPIYIQSASPAFQVQQPHSAQGSVFQTPVSPTPGHNERVNMNRDLSLSPPPQPGNALKEYLPNQ